METSVHSAASTFVCACVSDVRVCVSMRAYSYFVAIVRTANTQWRERRDNRNFNLNMLLVISFTHRRWLDGTVVMEIRGGSLCVCVCVCVCVCYTTVVEHAVKRGYSG